MACGASLVEITSRIRNNPVEQTTIYHRLPNFASIVTAPRQGILTISALSHCSATPKGEPATLLSAPVEPSIR